MEGKANQAAVVYEEFEPLCKWQRKEDRDILEIHLEEFKKEQLKVQISNHGILKISGERPIDASTKAKFHKEVSVSSGNYDTSAIHAKFIHGKLYITLPKKKTPIPEIEKPPTPAETATKTNEQPPKEPQMAAKDHRPTAAAAAPKDCLMELKRRTPEARLTKVAVTLAATAALMAVLLAYVVYMYKTTTDTAESLDVHDWYMP